jgi:hypothetical protein
MQPYFFPYLGYYQLVNSADQFVFLDNLPFMKKGWIHRNYVLNTNGKQLLSVPLHKVSQNKLISETYLHELEYPRWRDKTLKSLRQSYTKAPYFEPTYDLLTEILHQTGPTIGDLAMKSIEQVARHIGIETRFTKSSELENLSQLHAQDRIIGICKQHGATQYVNPIGGLELYTEADFEQENISLRFLEMDVVPYQQLGNDFCSHLSIIDVLMFNSREEIQALLQAYHLKRDTKQLV